MLVMNPEDDDDVEMVEGILEMLTMVRDTENRMEMANKSLMDFAREGIQVNQEEFMRRVS